MTTTEARIQRIKPRLGKQVRYAIITVMSCSSLNEHQPRYGDVGTLITVGRTRGTVEFPAPIGRWSVYLYELEPVAMALEG
jgi:hypothetical protein